MGLHGYGDLEIGIALPISVPYETQILTVGRNAEFDYVKADGTYSNHWFLKD
jgi:hypothetical protein